MDLHRITTRLAPFLFAAFSQCAIADVNDFVPEPKLRQIAEEVSGEAAKRNLDQITQFHRMRASDGFDQAAQVVLAQLQSAGYKDATTLRFPADGKTMFGTQMARTAWQVKFAELWEVDSNNTKLHKMADWAARPLTLAQDSDSADVTALLVDVGAGTHAADYQDKNVAGKIVLTSSQPQAVAERAIKQLGAVGVLSYAANQKTAWWQLDETLVRWGHLPSFRDYPAFAFMTSLGDARKLQMRLAAGEPIRLHAKVEARREKGEYRLVTARLAGSDPLLKNEEILFSCHLDHPRPGANDNASGCVAILEVARSLKRLVDDGRLPAPKRSIRFIWPSEIESSLILLNAKPDLAKQFKHVIHMDMVGGGPETKAVFHASRGPYSVADVSGDLLFELIDFMNRETLAYASGQHSDFPLTAPEGGREPLLAQKQWLELGSDNQIYAEGSWAIPITYLHDWPDRYIHTHKDLPDNIDPTKLKRAAFLGLAQGWILANLDSQSSSALNALQQRQQWRRTAELQSLLANLDPQAQQAARRGQLAMEMQMAQSVRRYLPSADIAATQAYAHKLLSLSGGTQPQSSGPVWQRNSKIKGTMDGFGFSYLEHKLGRDGVGALDLLNEVRGEDKAYEALNLVNGIRSQSEIYDLLQAQFGQISPPALDQYLNRLAEIGVILAPKAQ